MVKIRNQEDWQDMNEAWLDDPQQAASHMVFGMDLHQRQKARQQKTKKSTPTWV